MNPTLYISHGAPDRVAKPGPAHHFLTGLAEQVPAPKAILTVSAHWESDHLILTDTGEHQTIHDFYGFPRPLYDWHYPARQTRALTELLTGYFSEKGIDIELQHRGLDHGSWSVLALSHPQADIPVASLSLPRFRDLNDYLLLGEQLRDLRTQGVLILATGSATHNLGMLSPGGPAPQWAAEFVEWLQNTVASGKYDDLANLYLSAPHGRLAHPTAEHFAPLLIAAGAARDETAELIHDSFELGSLNNSSWRFG